MARAFAFPHAFAPEGKLREVEPISYMVLMNQHYAFRTSQQDLTLELREENEDGEVAIRTKVGEAYSVDFQWDEYETLRLHLIAVRPNHDRVVKHYDVFDMGSAGNAYAIPMRAWDNWRQYAHDKPEGVPVDKRLVYMAIGDRAQIGNMTLEQFAELTCDQVEALQDARKPGMMLIRPSIEDAWLDESPKKTTPPPCIELSSSSSSSGSGSKDKDPEEVRKNELKAKLKARRERFGGRSNFGRGGKFKPRPYTHKQLMARGYGLNYSQTFLGPDGKPYPRTVVENLDKLFTECVHGSPPRTSPTPSDTLDEASIPPTSSFDGDTSVEQSSLCDISGVTGFKDESMSSTNWEEHGPLPMDDSVEVFLSKMVNESQIINVSSSSDGSVLDVTKGQACGSTEM